MSSVSDDKVTAIMNAVDMSAKNPFLNKRWYELYARMARPTLQWVGVIGAAYAVFIGHLVGKPMDAAYAFTVLGFVCVLYGLRGIEKMKGVA